MSRSSKSLPRPAYIPFWFTAILSLIAIVADLAQLSLTGHSDGLPTAFIAFLPMSFYVVGLQLTRLQDENEHLREQLVEFEKKHAAFVP